jgi:hypothetical protein
MAMSFLKRLYGNHLDHHSSPRHTWRAYLLPLSKGAAPEAFPNVNSSGVSLPVGAAVRGHPSFGRDRCGATCQRSSACALATRAPALPTKVACQAHALARALALAVLSDLDVRAFTGVNPLEALECLQGRDDRNQKDASNTRGTTAQTRGRGESTQQAQALTSQAFARDSAYCPFRGPT